MKSRRALIVGIKSLKLSNEESLFLRKFKPWGVILFSRNIKSIKQTRNLTNSIKKIFKDKKYPILIDQEGGRVNRLNRIINFDNYTSEYFGNLFLKDEKKFIITFKLFIDKTSYILNNLGININTVPVLDLKYKGASNVIGDRAFSKDKYAVSKIGDICIRLFHENSISTVIKHIPGHGLASVDSHNFRPIVKKTIKYLNENDFYTFKEKKSLFAMTAHIIYQKLDNINPATHSRKTISYIRKNIGFKSILISDDISMKSLKNNIKTNTLKAFDAGCNLVLHCNGNLSEMETVANNSPFLSRFILKKTSQFYKILS